MTLGRRQNMKASAGFTLLEALIAIALMGLILAALATITAQWLPNWSHGIARVQLSDDTALALERLTADLAVAEFIPASRETHKPLFDGTDRSVIFVRTMLGPNSGTGLEIVRISEVRGEQGPVLVRTRAPFTPGVDRTQPTFTDPVVLLRPPYRISFAYAGIDRNWREDWRDQVQPPRAIKLTVHDAASRRTRAISTATLVRVEVPMECIGAKSLPDCLAHIQPSQSAAAEKPRL